MSKYGKKWFDSPAHEARRRFWKVRDAWADYLMQHPIGREYTKVELWRVLKAEGLASYRTEAAEAFQTLFKPFCEEREPVLVWAGERILRTAQRPTFSD